MSESKHKFKIFLENLGYELPKKFSGNKYTYNKTVKFNDVNEEVIELDFSYLPEENDEEFYKLHQKYWNENRANTYVIVTDEKSYLIDAKIKPPSEKEKYNTPQIASFNYGTNTYGYENNLDILKRRSVDNGLFWDFVTSNIKYSLRLEVDKDLLLNLISLKNKLLDEKNDEIVHLLILRCLFVKYLEDRGIYQTNYLVNILRSKSAESLFNAFEEIKKINGDIFKFDTIKISDIKPKYIKQLEIFFTSDYRTGQGSLFPYKFDVIPEQLISHVYEALLKTNDRQNKGIYYTPVNIVRFMLANSLKVKICNKKNLRLLDPACGSGIFLVEAFKMIIDATKANNNYDMKVQILQKQLFGIDNDPKALQIAVFSLYLTLLKEEDSDFIKQKIKDHHPILPSLIGKTLIKKNTIVDKIDFIINDENEKFTFDCIVTNPPWGAVPLHGDNEDQREREAKITNPIYNCVSRYQRSQYFMLKVLELGNKDTIYCFIVNNSNFYNDKSLNFRKRFLDIYQLLYFYELSNINQILFSKKKIGEIKNGDSKEQVIVGADEPSAILIFKKKSSKENIVNFITPHLNKYILYLKLFAFSSKDIKLVRQEDLANEDLLWKIFVNGSWEDYVLISKIKQVRDKNVKIKCYAGMKPQKNMDSLGKPILKKIINGNDFERYFLHEDQLNNFDINREMERSRKNNYDKLFTGKRLLAYVSPAKVDGLRLRTVFTDKEYVFKDDIIAVKFEESKNIQVYEAIFNSSVIGYYLYNISAQWGKGPKHIKLRNEDLEMLPIPNLDRFHEEIKEIKVKVNEIRRLKNKYRTSNLKKNKKISERNLELFDNIEPQILSKIEILEKEIDKYVYTLYDLRPFEIDIIEDFFRVNLVNGFSDIVTKPIIVEYASSFREIFKFILKENKWLNIRYKIDRMMGTLVCFVIVNTNEKNSKLTEFDDNNIFNLVLKKRIIDSYFSDMLLKENKVKIYDNNKFFIIKSNKVADWTKSQALKDAKEEITEIMRKLS